MTRNASQNPISLAFGAAGAAVIAGAVLWFTGGPIEAAGDAPDDTALRVVPTFGSEPGLALVGGF